jgi:YbbR domain-containing protein
VRRLVGLVVHNWPLKLAAIALAFLLYAGLVVSQSQFEFTTPVPIQAINQPTDAVILGNLPAVTRIRYIVNGDVGAGPTTDSFRATVDLSGVDPSAGSTYRTVDVTSVDPRFLVIDYEPRGINVQLDPYTSYTVPVTVDTGQIPEGLEIGPTTKSQDTVIVSGPDSVVRYVAAAQADVAIDPHGLSVDRDVPLIPVDNLGKVLSPVRVDPPTVHITIPVFSNAQTKTLPVNPIVVGTPPTGYAIDKITVDPTVVGVKGDAPVLATVTKADTEPISVGAVTGTIETDVKLNLPTGVVPDRETVHVTITMRAETATRTFDAALVLSGRQPGLDYQLSTGSVFVTVGGPTADLDRIDPASFTITLDVAGLGPGSHELRPVPNLQAGLRLLKVDPETVTVTVSSATGSGDPTSSAAPSGAP